MAARHQVTCITKSNRTDAHERITHIGGKNADGTAWKITQEAAIQSIDKGEWQFYVRAGGREVNVIIATRSGKRYLKTESDGEQPNNLLSLSECS